MIIFIFSTNIIVFKFRQNSMPPRIKKQGSSKKSSKNPSGQSSSHNIFESKFTNAPSNQNLDNFSEQSSFNLDESKGDEERQGDKAETIEKVLNRLGLEQPVKIKDHDQELEMLVGNIVENCVGTIDTESNLDHYEKMYSSEYQEMVKSRGKGQSRSSIIVNELNEVEKIELMGDEGLLAVVKEGRLFFKRISIICRAIVEHNLFESFILIIIVLNSVKMALDDPLTSDDSNPTIENTFIVLYTLEMSLKICAYGFVFNEKAYLRDLWNMLDFVIVVTSLLPFIVKLGFSVNSLRAIRVLRPLKTITKVKALKMIVSTLFYSFSLVMDSLYILFFVIIVFSIAGTQLFSGVLKNRCIELATGTVTDTMCTQGGGTCGDGYLCGRGISSPNFSINNFDTFLWSMLSVFQTLTLEGWSQIMISLQKCYSVVSVLYSLLIIFFCEYVLLNMTMAILKYKYSQVKGNTIEEEEEEQSDYEPEFLRKLGIFKSISHVSLQPPLQRYFAEEKVFVGAIEFNKHLSNSFSKCMEASFEAPPATRKSLGRIKTVNLDKNKKFDLSKLNRGVKLEEYKWDAKTLQFESIDINSGPVARESMKQIRLDTEERQDEPRESIMEVNEEDSFSMDSISDDCSSDCRNENNIDIDEKIYEMKMKLGQSRKNIPENPLDLEKSKVAKKPDRNKENRIPQLQSLRPEVKEMNEVLGLVNETYLQTRGEQGTKVPSRINLNGIVIPQINFVDYKVDRLYERFNDLGEYRVKRVEKLNQLNFFNIKQQRKHAKLPTKEEPNLIRQIAEENSLDIKELQLVNELIKKQMKCRIKEKQELDAQEKYNKARILVFQAMKEQAKKAEELENNMRNLNFVLTYKSDYDAAHSSGSGNSSSRSEDGIEDKLAVNRNYESRYKGLRITEFQGKVEQKDSQKVTSSRSIGTKAANYMKMLQNHKMEEKIKFEEEDRIMAIFFKKEKEVKNSQPIRKYEEEYKATQEADIFNRHGHIKITCPTQLSQEFEDEFLASVNIKDEEYEIYMKGILGLVNVLRKKTLLFINRPFYDNFMLMLVLANTVTLSLNGLVDTSNPIFVNANTAFTISFAVDLGLKIFSYGFDFFSDLMSIFDSFVVSISIVELAVGTGGNLSALRSVRILRAFRVLRVTRLIRSLNYMKIVMSVVSSVITEFIYIFMLLALFIFIYTLLGMQIFGGELLPQSVTGVRQNFDTFFNAVFSVFQLLTVENWNDIQTAVMASSATQISGIIYIVSWIFIGNWILLNLLQAILLDGFDKDSAHDPPEEEEDEDEAMDNPEDDEEEKSTEQGSVKQRFKTKDASLLLFYPSSCIRTLATRILTSTSCSSSSGSSSSQKTSIFENVMVVVIALSSIKLVMDTYISPGTQLDEISKIIDIVFNCIFIVECGLKIISKGMIIGDNAYLKDSWSKLDFFIVCTALVDMFVEVDLSILKLFRILRPLRIVSRNLEMKIIISSLGQSMCGILNVLIIILCVFLMFGILGINLLQGKLDYCSQTEYISIGQYGPYGVDEGSCIAQGGVWATQFINFENILNSLMSLYVFSTRQNWPYYVFTFIDSSDSGPSKDANQLLYMLFSVVFIFICSYFFMDLLVGVLFMNFHEAELKLKPKTLTDKQINWQNLQKIIISEDPCFQLYLKPDNRFRLFFYRIVSWKPFDLAITVCILLNIVAMILNQDDQTQATDDTLTKINFGFSIVFLTEMLLKLMAYSRAYFLSGWNIFDFFVVMASVLDIIMGYTGVKSNQSSALAILPQIARIFRVLRVTRLLRMFKRFKGLQKLIETFIFSLPALGRGLSIVSLFLFICSVLASYLFSNIVSDHAGSFTQHRNFQNFHQSIQTLFIMTTGENWYYYMYETIYDGYIVCKPGTTCVQMGYLAFWLVYVFLSQKVFMELFVLIVLDQFESNYIQENNPLGIFALFEDDFRTNWIEITTKYNSQKIETKRLLDLLLVLKQPLGLGKKELMSKYEEELKENEKLTEEEIKVSLKELDLKLKKNGAKLIQRMDIIKNRLYLSYHETFYRFAKMALMPEYSEKASSAQKAKLDEMHKASEAELEQLMPKGNNYEPEDGEETSNNEPLNPIELILFSQMIVKSWYNYSLKYHSEKSGKGKSEHNDSLNNSCSSEVEEAGLEKLPVERRLEKRKGMLEVGGQSEASYEFKLMPNIDDHYQNEKKRGKKGNTSSNLRGTNSKGGMSMSMMKRFTSNSDRKTENNP